MKRNIWFTSDQHFGHKVILDFTDRPCSDLEDMELSIIKKWNKQVNKNDIVYILGDFVWNTVKTDEYKSILSRLNGNKILIVGNHDDMRTCRGLNLGFSDVLWGAEIIIGKTPVVLSHYPYKYGIFKNLFTKVKYLLTTGKFPKVSHLTKRPINNGKWLIHGHTHSKTQVNDKMIHVGWDVGYRLFNIGEIASIIYNKENKWNSKNRTTK